MLLLRAWLRSLWNASPGGMWRRSARAPLACSIMIRLFSARCSWSARRSAANTARSCRIPTAATSGERLAQPDLVRRERLDLHPEQVERADAVAAQQQGDAYADRIPNATIRGVTSGQRSWHWARSATSTCSPVRHASRHGPWPRLISSSSMSSMSWEVAAAGRRRGSRAGHRRSAVSSRMIPARGWAKTTRDRGATATQTRRDSRIPAIAQTPLASDNDRGVSPGLHHTAGAVGQHDTNDDESDVTDRDITRPHRHCVRPAGAVEPQGRGPREAEGGATAHRPAGVGPAAQWSRAWERPGFTGGVCRRRPRRRRRAGCGCACGRSDGAARTPRTRRCRGRGPTRPWPAR